MDPTKVDKDIAQAIDKAGESDDNLIRLSTGVILAARQANPSMLIRVMANIRRPEPPLVFMEKMGRYIENAADPDYIERVKSWDMEYNAGMLNALIGLGTTLHSKPKSVPGPDDEGWISEYAAYNLETHPDSKAWRYMTWVLFIAAPTDKDLKDISAKVKSFSGVPEANVRDAENFPAGDKADR